MKLLSALLLGFSWVSPAEALHVPAEDEEIISSEKMSQMTDCTQPGPGCEDGKFSVQEQGSKSAEAKSCKALGKRCHFPFKYAVDGLTYHHCTKKFWHKKWCGTSAYHHTNQDWCECD